jgi:hypothetical protein
LTFEQLHGEEADRIGYAVPEISKNILARNSLAIKLMTFAQADEGFKNLALGG